MSKFIIYVEVSCVSSTPVLQLSVFLCGACSQKRRLAYKSKRNWLSRVVLKTISNILHHWDYKAFTDRMAQPTAASTNPVVEKSIAPVLCLHCFGDNSERFKFCQHCGVAVDSATEYCRYSHFWLRGFVPFSSASPRRHWSETPPICCVQSFFTELKGYCLNHEGL